jgi:hypothetical protein
LNDVALPPSAPRSREPSAIEVDHHHPMVCATARLMLDDRHDAARVRAPELADEYLQHDPDGTLAREAVGHRMDWNLVLGRILAQ